MAITPWEPFTNELRHLREMVDRLFEEPMYWPRFPSLAEGVRMLPVDLYKTPDQAIVRATVAGVQPEHVEITVRGNLLTIRAERKEEAEVKGGETIRRERFYGRMERSLTLPTPVKAETAQATFENGEPTLRLPKVEEAKAKHIKVQTTKM